MYKQCATEKAALQQRKIEECLLSMMQDKSIQEISVSGLCEHTGLSRKTFYRLFESKQDVLHSLIDRTIREYIPFRLPKDVLSPNAPVELLTFYAYWLKQRPLLNALSKNSLSPLLYDRCIRHATLEDTSILQQLGLEPSLLHSAESLQFILSGLLTLVVGRHHNGYQKSPLEMALITDKLLSRLPIQHPD